MARHARPWYRASKDAWYVEIDGRQVRLAKGKGAKPKVEALKAFHAEMAARDTPPTKLTPNATVAKVGTDYLARLQARAAKGEIVAESVVDWTYRAGGFFRVHAALQARSVTPDLLQTWLQDRNLGPTSAHDAASAVVAAFRWATPKIIQVNPLAGFKGPQRRPRRTEVLTDTVQARKLIDAIRNPEFRDLIEFLFATGCRPGEASKVTVDDFDPVRRTLTLVEHKTAKMTGRDRVIVLTDAAFKIVVRLVATHQTGLIFRNSKGRPWNKYSINCAICRLRKRTGASHKLVAYAFRHLFITDALDHEVPIATVAALAGHSSTAMVSRVYSRLDSRVDHLRSAAAKVRS